MMEVKKVRTKICLIGDGGVGKTSLIRRFVHDMFNDKYITTIGTKVSSKNMILNYPHLNTQVQMKAMIWDIMGQKGFRSLLMEAYFSGANGIIGVCSLTDRESLFGLLEWIESIQRVVDSVPMIILANKCDLKDFYKLDIDELNEVAGRLNTKFVFTSAKTGENVADAFIEIGKKILKDKMHLT